MLIGSHAPTPQASTIGDRTGTETPVASDSSHASLSLGSSMDVLLRANQEPDCVQAAQTLEEAHKRLEALQAKISDTREKAANVDATTYTLLAVPIVAASAVLLGLSCLMPPSAMMVAGPLTLTASAVMSFKITKSDSREFQAKCELPGLLGKQKKCAQTVSNAERQLDDTVHAAADRLFKEAMASLSALDPEQKGSVDVGENVVKIGNVVIARRETGESAPT